VSPQSASHHKLEKDEYLNPFFMTPRTLTTLGLLVLFLNALSYDWIGKIQERTAHLYEDPDNEDVFRDYRWPVFFGFFAVVVFASAQFPDTAMKRPHPLFWRMLLGAEICYACFMTFIFLLPRDKARYAFKIFHPALGNDLPERNYADDCRVFTPENPVSSIYNIYDAVWDIHFIAHFGGWWGKMLIIRDTKIAWIASASFELIEISFRHWLPNFWECWWDHLLLDLFGCNLIGIFLGALTIKYMGVSRINWMVKKQPKQEQIPDNCSGMSKVVMKMKPEVFVKYEWNMFQSLTRYSQVIFYIWFILSVDAMNFFLKFCLWVSAESDLLLGRVLIWGFAAIATSREFYEFIDDPNCKRVGPFFWTSTYVVLIEYSIVFKFSQGLFVEPFPWYSTMIICVYISLILLGGVYSYLNGKHLDRQKKAYNITDPELTIENTSTVLAEGEKKRK